jgi:hypothetical protein
MATAVDSSSPVRVSGNPASGASITSASFTAPDNSLLVACVQGNPDATGTETLTVTDSGSLTWTQQVQRTNLETTAGGSSTIFTAPQVTSASRTVTLTRTMTVTGARRIDMKIYVVTGADLSGTPVDTVSASNEGGSTTNNLTTTSLTPGADGHLFASDGDWGEGGTFDASSDLTQDSTTYAGEYSVCSGYKTCTSGVTANLNAGGSGAVQHKWTQIIVRAAAAATGWGALLDRSRNRLVGVV